MLIAVGSDHGGFYLKQTIKEVLTEMGHEYEDFGSYNPDVADYPDIAFPVADAVAQSKFERGVLICGTGIGMSMAANRIPGVRAALCHDVFSAKGARQHNDANILCMGERVIGPGLAKEIVIAYLSSEFEGGRHANRLEKMQSREQ